MRIAVVGAGRVGTALAVLFGRAGHTIVAVAGRDATPARAAAWLPGVPVLDPTDAARLGELVIVAVPDDAIGDVVLALVERDALPSGTWIAHTSGAIGLGVLDPARAVGARRLVIHPLQTLPDVERAIASIPGSTVAVTADDEEGSALGGSLARDLGATPFRLADERRPLYHAAAVFASNHVVASSAVAERLFRDAGLPDPLAAMEPLQAATVENIARIGPRAALTGPAVRGDAGTVTRNLEALAEDAPDAVAAYVAMCRIALDVATAAGRLAPEGRAAVEEVLAAWS